MARLIINGSAVEAPDGVTTVFTVPFTVVDPTQFWAFTGEPGELETYVTPGPPNAGEFTLVGQVLTYGLAPTRHNLRYYTSDLAVDDSEVVFLDLTSTGNPLVWTGSQAPRDNDSVDVMYGEPGALIYRVDSSPGVNEYTLSVDGLTYTLGLALAPTSKLRAMMIAQSLASAIVVGVCDGSAFYTKLQATALRLIKKFGVQMVITKATTPAYDPQTDTVTSGSTSANFYGVRFPIDNRKVDGETIRVTDQQVFAQLDTPPKVMDRISDGAIDFTIAHISEIAPGCVPVMYELAVRA